MDASAIVHGGEKITLLRQYQTSNNPTHSKPNTGF